jgi:hypothetical protein
MTTARGPESGDYELSLILDGLYYTEAKETCSGLADADTQYTHIEGRLKEIHGRRAADRSRCPLCRPESSEAKRQIGMAQAAA